MTERTNWAGNYVYRARALHRPETVEQLQELIAGARRIRVLGSRHTFTGIGDSEELVTLDGLPGEVIVHPQRGTASVPAAMKYGELAARLATEGLALANLASLPHISVAGAIATATHGSGDRNGNLAVSVAALELVGADGQMLSCARGDDDFEGMVVALGALGAVTRVTLDVEPAYEMRQRVFERLGWNQLLGHLDQITEAGYSVSAFSRWGSAVDQVWIKSRVTDAPEDVGDSLFGAVAATGERHPILGLDPVNCTAQLGVAGPWYDRLPHFRMGFTPSSGEEIQSEYLVARDRAAEAIEAVRALATTVAPLTQVSEIRTIAADQLWLSPQYGRDTVGIHFTWVRDQPAVERALHRIEGALLPLGARPHWGKLFLAGGAEICSMYERRTDFVALAERLDPGGTFRNEWLEARVLNPAPAANDQPR